MKNILVFIFMLLMVFSSLFAERESAIDLIDIFEGNQAGFGYDGGQFDTSLYTDVGTEEFRVTINILDLGGSFFNNTLLEDNTTTPVLRGIPRFFLGMGYDFGYNRLMWGYGMSKVWDATNTNKMGFMAHDASLAFQAFVGEDYILKIAVPVQIGFGTGHDNDRYDLTKVMALLTTPEFRLSGDSMWPLSEIRFALPFGMTKAKDRVDPTTDIDSMTIGADLRMYFNLSFDPIVINLVPRVIFKMPISGNKLETKVMGESSTSILNGNFVFQNDDILYNFDKPWNVRLDIQLELSGTDDNLISLWAGPLLRFEVFGATDIIFYKDGNPFAPYSRDDKYIMGLGYELPIELTIKPLETFHLKLGLIATGDIFNGDNVGVPLRVSVDGGVIWYF